MARGLDARRRNATSHAHRLPCQPTPQLLLNWWPESVAGIGAAAVPAANRLPPSPLRTTVAEVLAATATAAAAARRAEAGLAAFSARAARSAQAERATARLSLERLQLVRSRSALDGAAGDSALTVAPLALRHAASTGTLAFGVEQGPHAGAAAGQVRLAWHSL